jgi:hypothetical protein
MQLPVGVFNDLLAGRLRDIDVAVLGVVLLMFANRRIHKQVARDVSWRTTARRCSFPAACTCS